MTEHRTITLPANLVQTLRDLLAEVGGRYVDREAENPENDDNAVVRLRDLCAIVEAVDEANLGGERPDIDAIVGEANRFARLASGGAETIVTICELVGVDPNCDDPLAAVRDRLRTEFTVGEYGMDYVGRLRSTRLALQDAGLPTDMGFAEAISHLAAERDGALASRQRLIDAIGELVVVDRSEGSGPDIDAIVSSIRCAVDTVGHRIQAVVTPETGDEAAPDGPTVIEFKAKRRPHRAVISSNGDVDVEEMAGKDALGGERWSGASLGMSVIRPLVRACLGLD